MDLNTSEILDQLARLEQKVDLHLTNMTIEISKLSLNSANMTEEVSTGVEQSNEIIKNISEQINSYRDQIKILIDQGKELYDNHKDEIKLVKERSFSIYQKLKELAMLSRYYLYLGYQTFSYSSIIIILAIFTYLVWTRLIHPNSN